MVHALVYEWSSNFLEALALISEHFYLLPQSGEFSLPSAARFSGAFSVL
jgi:hypothetical protein